MVATVVVAARALDGMVRYTGGRAGDHVPAGRAGEWVGGRVGSSLRVCVKRKLNWPRSRHPFRISDFGGTGRVTYGLLFPSKYLLMHSERLTYIEHLPVYRYGVVHRGLLW